MRKRKVWELSNNCFYCETPLTYEEATVDHKIPKSKGGSNQLSNLVTACEECNRRKADHINFDRKDLFKHLSWWPQYYKE